MTLDEQNAARIEELKPDVRWAGRAWLAECQRLNIKFRVSEVYRSPERQHSLWASHFVHKGPWRTDLDGYKKKSMHQLRLAADVYPINCTHFDIAQVAEQFGITHPFPTQDPPHYQFDKVAKQTAPVTPHMRLSAEAERKQFVAAIKRSAGKRRSDLIRRYRNQYGTPPLLD